MRGYDALATIADRADLKRPDCIRSSNLRKYMATMTQVGYTCLVLIFIVCVRVLCIGHANCSTNTLT